MKRYFIRLSTGDCGIGFDKLPSPRRPARNEFLVRVRGETQAWPDYDIFETNRWHWWFSRFVGA